MEQASSPERHSIVDFGMLARDYDRWYETHEGQEHDRFQKSDVRRLLTQPRPGHRLLDVGGGTAHWGSFFASIGYAVISVDVSEEMARLGKSRTAPHCRFVVADACYLPFGNRSFEAVAAMAALEFITDVPRALGEMFRCVKPGGAILAGTLNRLAPLNLDRVAKGKHPYASARLLAPDELYELLAPWGQVRMIASSVGVGVQDPTPKRAPEIPRNVSIGSLSGPFIVAEVRTASHGERASGGRAKTARQRQPLMIVPDMASVSDRRSEHDEFNA